MGRRPYRGNADILPILDVTEMNWKCGDPLCPSKNFKLLHYTPAAMSTICAKCGHRNTNIGPQFPLLINSTPQAVELKVTDKGLLSEVSGLRVQVEQLEERIEKNAG